MSTPTAPPIPDELERILRRMRLPYLRKAAPDVLATARARRWDPRGAAGAPPRGGGRPRRRHPQDARKQASFPTGKTFSSWRAEDSSIPEATQNALQTLEWVGRAENLAIAGPSGTGKSHFVEALAHAAIEADLRVVWFTLETLTAGRTDGHEPGAPVATRRENPMTVDMDQRMGVAVAGLVVGPWGPS
jgi:ABC-type glutathione transport system ATPase component